MRTLIGFKYKYLVLFILITPLWLWAQGSISVESQVDRSTAYIGDVIQYSVIVTHDPDVNVIMPELAQNLGQFELRDYKVEEPRKQDGKIISRTDYSLSTFDTGEFTIPELQIGYTTKTDSTEKFFKTEPLLITVQSLDPEKDGDIRDIKPPRVPDRDYRDYILWGLIGLGVLIVAGAAWYFIRRYRQGKSLLPVKQKPQRPAHEVALEALQALVQGSLLTDGEVKTYYIQLSDIIRQYIRDRFFIDAPEMTTGQLLNEMDREGLKADEIGMISEFLNGCDLVKFAKYIPGEKENEIFTQLAFDFVERTKIVIIHPEEPKEITPDSEPATEELESDEPAAELPAVNESRSEEAKDV